MIFLKKPLEYSEIFLHETLILSLLQSKKMYYNRLFPKYLKNNDLHTIQRDVNEKEC